MPPGLIAVPVLPGIVDEQYHGYNGRRSLCDKDSDLSRSILWCISGLEGLRTDDVTDGERPGDEGASKCALSVTGTVGHGPLVENR